MGRPQNPPNRLGQFILARAHRKKYLRTYCPYRESRIVVCIEQLVREFCNKDLAVPIMIITILDEYVFQFEVIVPGGPIEKGVETIGGVKYSTHSS